MNEIDLREYIFILWRKLWVIAVAMVMTVSIGIFISRFILETEYQSFTTLMVGKAQEYNGGIEYSDILLNEKLVTTYGEIAKSRHITNEVIKNLNLNIDQETLRKKVNVTLIPDTEIIKIDVVDSDPKLAAKIADEVAKTFIENVVRIMRIENIQVIDKAQIPVNPIKPNMSINIFITVFLGMFGGILVVLVPEFFNNTLRTTADIEKNLGLIVIGTIPDINRKYNGIKMNVRGIVFDKNIKSTSAEAFRTLRTNIRYMDIDKEIKTIVVTSAGFGEGKSTIAANLAVALSQVNERVLLIDSDLRKPVIHKFLNLSNITGLTNILYEKKGYKEVVQETEITNLSFISSGPIPHNPSELLSSDDMKSLVDNLKEDYTTIILDSPPVTLVTDSSILSVISDGVIFVCKSGESKIEITKQAKVLLNRVNANILGVVMNKVPTDNEYFTSNYR